jgi:hypothetical protein
MIAVTLCVTAFSGTAMRPAAAAIRASTPTMVAPQKSQSAASIATTALLAAGLVFCPADDAHAARGGGRGSGGRVGGRAPTMRAAPRRSTTNIYVAPSVGYGMPMGGYGYGGYGYGGYGYSSPGLGLYMGLSFAEALLRESQRQVFIQQQLEQQRQLGQDQQAIQMLERQLAEQNQRIEALKMQGSGDSAPPVSDKERIAALERLVQEQQTEMGRMQLAR